MLPSTMSLIPLTTENFLHQRGVPSSSTLIASMWLQHCHVITCAV